MRRTADRRRPPGLRARPRPAAYGEQPRSRLHDGARRPRRPRLRVLEEPVGRPRRRGARPRRPSSAGCSPCASCWRPWPTTTAGSRWRSRPSTPPGTAAWSSGGWSSCCATSAGTSADSPVRVMSFSWTALQRVQRLAPEVPLVMLIEKAHHWPMLRRVIGPDWIVGPGITELRDHPGFGKRLVKSGRDIHVWTVNTDQRPRALPRAGGEGDHHRPAGVHAGAARRIASAVMGKRSRTKARDHVTPAGEVGPAPAVPVRLGAPLQGVPRLGRRPSGRLRQPAVRGPAGRVRRRGACASWCRPRPRR